MKNEAEIRGRILALRKIHGEIVGPLTEDQKRTTRLMIEQLLWVLSGEGITFRREYIDFNTPA